MFKPREPRVHSLDEPVQSTADIEAIIERSRVSSAHDMELAKLLDEIEPYLGSGPDPSPRPMTGTQFDLF